MSQPAEARCFVLIGGAPASGKTTLARALAPELGLPLLSKDTLKHGLMTVLPVPDVTASRRLGRAAVAALLAVAADTGGAVLDSVWHRGRAVADLQALPGRVVEVFCRCDRDVVHRRYDDRAGTRHEGHFDADRSADELWNEEITEPVAGGWPVLEVDTSMPVDVAALAREIRAAWRRSSGAADAAAPRAGE